MTNILRAVALSIPVALFPHKSKAECGMLCKAQATERKYSWAILYAIDESLSYSKASPNPAFQLYGWVGTGAKIGINTYYTSERKNITIEDALYEQIAKEAGGEALEAVAKGRWKTSGSLIEALKREAVEESSKAAFNRLVDVAGAEIRNHRDNGGIQTEITDCISTNLNPDLDECRKNKKAEKPKSYKWKVISETTKQDGEVTTINEVTECEPTGAKDAFEFVAANKNPTDFPGAKCYSAIVLTDSLDFYSISQKCMFEMWGQSEVISSSKAVDEMTVNQSTVYKLPDGSTIEAYSVWEQCD